MWPSLDLIRAQLGVVLQDEEGEGRAVAGLREELDGLPDSHDAMVEFARKLADLPLRDDWPYVEPDDLDGIWAECDPARPRSGLASLDEDEASARVEAAFLARVCGCVLGKPIEISPTLDEIRRATVPLGDWPLRDYISEGVRETMGRPLHRSAGTSVREHLTCVPPDDDLNYTVLGMLVLERHGTALRSRDIKDAWIQHLPLGMTFGPERVQLVKAGLATLARVSGASGHIVETGPVDPEWVRVLNPRAEWCGAVIRVDAYGYAALAHPALAAELAFRDASWTHRRTGVYASMFVAAAIATAPVAADPMEVFTTALGFVPQRSRFAERVGQALHDVRAASDWEDGYRRVHHRFAEYGHCRVYQEVGTLINTMRFAADVGDGITKQVSQGNDTDSFGATAGSLLGAYFGPGHLSSAWLEPFGDTIHTGLAHFHELRLSEVARRMGRLPARLSSMAEA